MGRLLRGAAILLVLGVQAPVTVGCGGAECVDDLNLWCFHSPEDRGPMPPDTDSQCTAPRLDDFPKAQTADCSLDYIAAGEESGLVDMMHFWNSGTGEHVATVYINAVPIYCNDTYFWYGERACKKPEG